jgi:hypothetical protein
VSEELEPKREIIEQPTSQDIPSELQHLQIAPGLLADKVATQDGRVFDLKEGVEVKAPAHMATIAGVSVDLSDWGTKGENFLRHMYDKGFLSAVQQDQVTDFFADEPSESSPSIRILTYLPDPRLINLCSMHKGGAQLKWTRERTFEEWVAFSIATLRWRMKDDLPNRYLLGWIGKKEEVDVTIAWCGEQLSVLEKYYTSSERQRLLGV